jgi:hypothetical protein
MGYINVSFRCVENVQRVVEDRDVCYANNLYEDNFDIPKADPSLLSNVVGAARDAAPTRTTREYIIKQIRKRLKKMELPKKIYKESTIVITYMWDEYQLAENGSL